MLIPFLPAAAWESTELSQTFMACVDAGRVSMKANDRQFADCLGVAYSRIAAMRSGQDAGPGFLRFASLPLAFWVGFLKEWGVRFGVLVITELAHARMIKWINRWMVLTMRRDMASMYPNEDLSDLSDVEETVNERKSA